MTKNNVLVLDIETKPKPYNDLLDKLLLKKVRSLSTYEAVDKKRKYSFRSPVFADVTHIGTLFEDADTGDTYQEQFVTDGDEKKLIKNFIDYITPFKGTYVHFNGLDFDCPFILTKCALYGIIPPDDFCKLIRFSSFPHYDLMQVLTCWGKFPMSLEEACVMFGITNPKEVLGNMAILEFLETASVEDIAIYNMEDVRSTYKVYKQCVKIFQ